MPVVILIIFGVVVVLTLSFLVFQGILNNLRGPTSQVGINRVFLSVTPTEITEGDGQVFTAVVTAFGFSTTPTPRNYTLQLFDDEAFDDKLAELQIVSTKKSGLSPVPAAPPSTLFIWNTTDTFTLTCTDGEVVGALESSGESEAELYARFIINAGDPSPVMESARVVVRCLEPVEDQ